MRDLAVAAMLVCFLAGIGALYALVSFLLEIGRRILEALDSMSWLIAAVVLVIVGAVLYMVVNGAIAASRAMHLRSRQLHPRNGLWPQMYHGGQNYVDMNALNAQHLAIITQAQRRTAAQVRAVMQPFPQIPALPAPDVQVLPPPPGEPLSVQRVIDVDARVDPHWLLVGSTGSGKTAASHCILEAMARRIPMQAVICEPGGVNWKDRATATDTVEIARTIDSVKAELERRQAILRQSPYDHVDDLGIPYIVLVAEEIETLLDDLKLSSRELRIGAVIALREIARTGRKCGVLLMAITQSGSLDVFDSHVRRNMTNTLLFRSEHTVPEAWRLQGVKLSEVLPGWAYSVKHGGMVYFPQTRRPDLDALDLAQLLQPVQPPQLVAPIEVRNWPQPGENEALQPVATSCEPVVEQLPRLARNQPADDATAALLRRLYAEGWSKNRLCADVWGGKDGMTWSLLQQALEGTNDGP